MNSEYLHVLITRFNLPTSSSHWQRDKHGRRVLTEKWMKDRFELFETFCYPSVTSQSTNNFYWLVYFSDDTEETYKARIDELKRECDLFMPQYIRPGAELAQHLSSTICKLLKPETDYLISSRIDNDDALNRFALEVIQNQFDHQEFQLINLCRGLVYRAHAPEVIAALQYRDGPFVSLIEKVKNREGPFTTVISKNHEDWIKEYPLEQLEDRFYWMQVIHKSNLANSLRGRPLLDVREISDMFRIRQKLRPNLFASLLYLGIHFVVIVRTTIGRLAMHPR